MRLRIVAAGLVSALPLFVAAPFTGIAGAQGYVGGTVTSASVDSTTVPEGGTFTVTGTTSPGNVLVTFILTSHPQNLGSTTSDANGSYSATLRIPCGTEQGAHTLTASSSGGSQSIPLTVSGESDRCEGDGADGASGTTAGRGGGGGGALARTGTASTAPLTAAGVGLVMIGAMAVAAARRRRSAQAIGS